METLSYCQLMERCIALAAENSALKEWSPNPHSASMWAAIEKAESLMNDGMPQLAMVEAFGILKMKRTPATDTFLAEVRATVVDADLLHTAASAIEDLLTNKDRTGEGVWYDVPERLRRAAMLQDGK